MTVPRFWREIPQRYNLQASKCGVCQAIHFPPRQVCPTCRRASIGKMTAVNLSGRGTVLEATRVHKPAPGFELQVPYIVALVQTAEGPIVTGQVVDSDEAAIVSGARVKAVFRRLGADGESGVIYYGTKWQLEPHAAPARSAGKADAAPKKKRLLERRKKA
ncbi:MAG: Zn-ribbon domain-containing OB-fold protein [Candidatus Thermoplasmatota archaeon]|jgi:hypothetical protein